MLKDPDLDLVVTMHSEGDADVFERWASGRTYDYKNLSPKQGGQVPTIKPGHYVRTGNTFVFNSLEDKAVALSKWSKLLANRLAIAARTQQIPAITIEDVLCLAGVVDADGKPRPVTIPGIVYQERPEIDTMDFPVEIMFRLIDEKPEGWSEEDKENVCDVLMNIPWGTWVCLRGPGLAPQPIWH